MKLPRLGKNGNTRAFIAAMIGALVLVACQYNPVTGERHFQLYGEDWEAQAGQAMYPPMKQSQGGDWIMDEDLTRYVQAVGNRLARQARRQDGFEYEFSILNNSVPNAWALPGGKIVINRGLLTEMSSEAELAAVLAHEIVHADAAHSARQQSSAALTQIGALVSMVVLADKADTPTTREIAMLVPQLGVQLINQRYSRDAEREADYYGMVYMSEAGYNPQGAVDLQKTFVNISGQRKADWLSGLFASHPPSKERLAHNRQTADKLGRSGETGEQAYRAATAYLRSVTPAYDAHEAASKALAEGDAEQALKHIERALALLPEEAIFLTTRGDVERRRGNQRVAMNFFRQAVEANDDLFYGHLRLGSSLYDAERFEEAETALQRSLELLPTADAHYLLGRLAQRRGQDEAAYAHFREAAGSQSEAGRKSRDILVRLELERSPERFITTEARVDRDGFVWVQLTNQTQFALDAIEVQYTWRDTQGRMRASSFRYGQPLPARASDQVALQFRLPTSTDVDRQFQSRVIAAEIADQKKA